MSSALCPKCMAPLDGKATYCPRCGEVGRSSRLLRFFDALALVKSVGVFVMALIIVAGTWPPETASGKVYTAVILLSLAVWIVIDLGQRRRRKRQSPGE